MTILPSGDIILHNKFANIKMAKNTSNARIPVKWVRDKAKAAYEKADTCYVCGTTQDLELHHFHSVTLLLNSWASRKAYDISTDDGILAVRDEFIAEHHDELYNQVRTLCNPHHVKLHGVFGKAPAPGSEARQSRWCDRQQAKAQGKTLETTSSFFSEFT